MNSFFLSRSKKWIETLALAMLVTTLCGCAAFKSNQETKSGNIWTRSMKYFGLAPDEKVARRAFDQGMELYQRAGHALEEDRRSRTLGYDRGEITEKTKGLFEAAEEKFQLAAKRLPDSPLEGNAMFFQAECQFFANRLADARDSYTLLLTKHKNPAHIDTTCNRLLAIAQYWQQRQKEDPASFFNPNLTDPQRPLHNSETEALLIYQTVSQSNVKGKLADEAIMALASAHFASKRYATAEEQYNLIRTEYSTSKNQYLAHLNGLISKLKLYQGPMYSSNPLDDAEKLLKRLQTQFPARSAKDRILISKLEQEVRAQRALRHEKMAKYYENGKYFRAAKQYYHKILKDYSNSPSASVARKRLAWLEGKPAEPPPRFVWLTKWFDSPTKRR